MTTAGLIANRGTNHLLQLCARIRLEGGVWDGKRALAFYQANGFDCELGRARANLERAAEQYPQLLIPVQGKRWTYETSANARVYFPEGALEKIADNRAFIDFARQRVVSALRGRPTVGEQRLLDAVHRTLNDYESQHEGEALSHTPDQDSGVVYGLRWALEASMWARFGDHPDYRPEWRP